ncbi:MAG: outer membrane beta-barrel protein [Flavobacteriales bacterium]|nr:outer membrane beta-barrel protein [Flavobacteriales bacterium]MCB9178527.1 outer membrane beta-barrel protein [Flavobacteriales bacterium]HPF89239.1 outer membrane beta-barrel protein [Flavobacteriales bacterium]
MRTALLLQGLLLFAPSQAQLFDLGVKGGVNQDDLRTNYSHSALVGGHAGVFARVKPPILPGVQGEVLVTSLGSRVSVEGFRADLRTAAVQLPLFMVLSLGPLELHAGAYYDRYLTKEFHIDQSIDLGDASLSVNDLADDGYGLLGGAGLRLGHFYAGARYLHGLQDLGAAELLRGVRSQQVQVYIGFGLFKAPD